MSNYNKVIFGTKRGRFSIISTESGNLKIEYKPKDKIYIISRRDNLAFDGTEDVGGIFYHVKKPKTIEEIIEHEVNILASLQKEAEVNDFLEFDWSYNKNKTNILIYPIFGKKNVNVEVNFLEKDKYKQDIMVGVRKKIRNNNG